jgi:hypothetical protein
MANEIQLNAFYQVDNLLTQRRQIPTLEFDQAGVGTVANTVAVPNDADLELELGGVSTVGLAYFQNLADPETNPTHVINIGADDTGLVPFIRLAPGQVALVFLGAEPYARAAAGTPSLYYEIFQR